MLSINCAVKCACTHHKFTEDLCIGVTCNGQRHCEMVNFRPACVCDESYGPDDGPVEQQCSQQMCTNGVMCPERSTCDGYRNLDLNIELLFTVQIYVECYLYAVNHKLSHAFSVQAHVPVRTHIWVITVTSLTTAVPSIVERAPAISSPVLKVDDNV